MDYPAMLYRCPGAHFGPDGATYDSIGVEDDAQLSAALANGWTQTIVQAVAIYHGTFNAPLANSVQNVDASEAEKINEGDETSPPTREELEQKANELGIKFDGRTTDRKLLEKIEEVLRGE